MTCRHAERLHDAAHHIFNTLTSVLVSPGSSDIGRDHGRSLSSGEANYALWWIQRKHRKWNVLWKSLIKHDLHHRSSRNEPLVFTEAFGSFTPACEKWEQKQKCHTDLFNIKETPRCSWLLNLFWMFIFVCCVDKWGSFSSPELRGDSFCDCTKMQETLTRHLIGLSVETQCVKNDQPQVVSQSVFLVLSWFILRQTPRTQRRPGSTSRLRKPALNFRRI